MRTVEDVLQSIQRYIGEALPEPWNIVLSLENDVPQRPFVVVKKVGPAEGGGGVARPTMTMAVTIYAFPERTKTRREAEQAEHDVADVLWSLFARGAGSGREERIPLYHYDPAWEVQRITPPADVWQIGYDGTWSPPLQRRVQPIDLQVAIEAIAPGLTEAGARVLGRLGGPYDLQAWMPLDVLEVRPDGAASAAPVERLRAFALGPWRDHREFVAVSQVTTDGQDDPEDPVMRQAIVRMRLEWGRGGRPAEPRRLIRGVRARATLSASQGGS